MKILKIEFQNINSLKGTHEIDFSKAPFTVSSLFAITGPTGSGKSTILDVIALALFNRVPRMPGNRTISKADIEKFGAVLTRNHKEAFAKITFETNSGHYTSKWSISTARTGNLRDYEMEITDLSSGRLFDLKKSEVPSKNEELIGLSYEQFIKAVLLAQGEFAQLLKAEKKERGELLEKITGTGIYRQLGIRAFQKFKQVNAEIEDRQRDINLLQNDLLEDEAVEQLNKDLSVKSAACAPLEKEVEKLKKNLDLKKNIEEHKKQVSEKEKLKHSADNQLQQFLDQYQNKIEKHEQVQVFAEDLRAWQNLDKTCKEIKEELAAQARNEKENEQNISSCLEKIRAFLKTEPETEKIEDSLQEFSRNVRNLQQQRKDKLNKFDTLKDQFHFEVREVPFKLNGDLDSEEQKLKEMKAAREESLEELREQLKDLNLEDPETEKDRLQQAVQLGRRAQQQASGIEMLSRDIEKAKKEEQDLLPQIEGLPKKIEELSKTSEAVRKDLKIFQLQRENEIITVNLEDLRHQLHSGEPCPLCGAKEHPYASGLPPKNDQLQDQIAEAQNNLDRLEREITGYKTSLGHYRKQLAEIQKHLSEKQPQLEAQKRDFEDKFSKINPLGENWELFCSHREQKLQLLEKFEKEKRRLSAIIAGVKIIPEIKEVVSQGKQIKTQLDELYQGNNIDTDCLNLQKSWTGFQHQSKSLKILAEELNRKLERRSGELKLLENSLQPKLTEIDCREIKEALERLMPENAYTELRKKREQLTSQKEQIEASLKTLREQYRNLKNKDVEETEEELTQKLTAAKKQLEELGGECEELRYKQRLHTNCLTKIAAIEKDLAGAKKGIRRWKLLDELIGDSKGNRFNDFAQDLSLSQLLAHANSRLKDLSDRYIIDKPEKDEDDSLVAIDEHMGGQRRSVKTLSGGETFLLSLSMALALSDLASRNVEINSLFIDEGFGTLDPETLDQTLDTLEKLQAESSKTIGVISHVDSLKERIATQIRLTRNGQGYSSLEIVG
ncbi:MAG: SbcC/MukB-like Walker B domain-containing protein [Salinimicrobium sediminis]|nr:SbcC/MukB-like Walker B domain-containing protein [Salinimicrobium sediminis]